MKEAVIRSQPSIPESVVTNLNNMINLTVDQLFEQLNIFKKNPEVLQQMQQGIIQQLMSVPANQRAAALVSVQDSLTEEQRNLIRKSIEEGNNNNPSTPVSNQSGVGKPKPSGMEMDK